MTTAAESRPRKPKKCKACKGPFIPARPLQSVCGPQCAQALISQEAQRENNRLARQERQAIRERKERLKTRSDWIKEAQQAVNAYVRARDAGLPCICCGRFPANGDEANAWDAGHYRSVGSAPHLRFDAERNIHRQLKQCNRYGSGRAVDYRIGLIARIGVDAVEALEADQSTKHYSIEDLKAIKAYYRSKTKELTKS